MNVASLPHSNLFGCLFVLCFFFFLSFNSHLCSSARQRLASVIQTASCSEVIHSLLECSSGLSFPRWPITTGNSSVLKPRPGLSDSGSEGQDVEAYLLGFTFVPGRSLLGCSRQSVPTCALHCRCPLAHPGGSRHAAFSVN